MNAHPKVVIQETNLIQEKLRELEIMAHSSNVPMDEMLRAVERQFIVAALARRGNNQCSAAIELGKHRNTIARAMQRLGLKPAALERRA